MTENSLPGAEPATYEPQLREKETRLSRMFAEFSPPLLEVYSSPASHYRLRAEFRLWHEGERCFYVMFEPGNRSKAFEVDSFPTGSELINQLMKNLLIRIQDQPVLRRLHEPVPRGDAHWLPLSMDHASSLMPGFRFSYFT